MQSRRITSSLVGTALIGLLAQTADTQQQNADTATDWPSYRHEESGTGHSPLRQINAGNVASLIRVWTYSLQGEASAAPNAGRGGGAGGVNSQATPIVVNGVMYLPAANRVVALDPESGKSIWEHVIVGGAPSRRGLAYWPGEGATAPRVTCHCRTTTARARRHGPDHHRQASAIAERSTSACRTTQCRSCIATSLSSARTRLPARAGGIGNPRAFDARTGAKLWEFSSVAQPGTRGNETWEGESWKGRLGANAWPFYFTVDVARGLLYLPLASPIPGNYGGDRKGANLFGNSVVAVDVQTGAYKWHFQTIHHDLWDADPPAPPSLFDIVRNGRTTPALGAHHEVWIPVCAESRNRSADLRRRGTSRSRERRSRRVDVSHSTLPGEAGADCARELHAKRSCDGRRHHARACAGVRRARRESRGRRQRGSIHAVAISRRRPRVAEHARVSRRARRRQLGRHRVRSANRLRLRDDAGCRCARLNRADEGGLARAVTRRPRPGARPSTSASATRTGRARSRRGDA